MKDNISINEAAKWLAEMAGADGEITPNERKVMKRFADTYGVDFSKLVRMSYAISGNNEREVQYVNASEMKGRQFEEMVVSLLADRSIYRLLSWRSDKIVDGIYAVENLLPDLEIKQRIGDVEVEYFVECKYRSSWDSFGKADMTKQILRYRNFAKEKGKELLIALGVGGTPDHPEEFYLIPSRRFSRYHDVPKERFKTCNCLPTAEAYYSYICRYFNHRRRKNIYESEGQANKN